MSQQNLLQLAKQGNSKAISALINRSLQPKGIIAKVTVKDGLIQIILESNQVLDKHNLVKFIHKGLTSLDSTAIRKVQICGKQIGEELSLWSHEFEIKKQSLNNLHTEKNKEQPTESKVKENSQKPPINLKRKITDTKNSAKNGKEQNKPSNAIKQESEIKPKNLSGKAQSSKQKLEFIKLSVTGVAIISVTLLLVQTVETNSTIVEANDSLIGRVDEFAKRYAVDGAPQEGVDKLSELAQKYKSNFWLSHSECSSVSDRDSEQEKQAEIEALESWELAFVNKQEQVKLFGKPKNSNETSLFQTFLNTASSRIVAEKKCGGIKQPVFPLKNIDISNDKYSYIVKVDQNAEISYLTFAYAQRATDLYSQQAAFQRATEDYIKSSIESLKSMENQLPFDLEKGYMICQELRNEMVTSKASINTAAASMAINEKSLISLLEDNSRVRQEYIAFAVRNLCPQLNP